MNGQGAGEQGEYATRPWAIPWRGWRSVVGRVWSSLSEDNLSIVSAGVGFYGLLAIFPAIAAFVTIYGLMMDPAAVEEQLAPLRTFMPADAYDILATQLHTLAAKERASLSVGLVLSIALTLWSAASGIKALLLALNIAYDEQEERGFIRLSALALAFTAGALLLVGISLFVIAAIPALVAMVPLPPPLESALLWTRWLVMAVLAIGGLCILYRYGPNRRPAKWRWVMPGAILATLLWLAASLAFSVYVAHFGSYDKTFGSLGAVVVLLMWFYLSAYAIGIGAELNAELERQTHVDTTAGWAKPRGRRGAQVADDVIDHAADDRQRRQR
jgi:membrane protein